MNEWKRTAKAAMAELGRYLQYLAVGIGLVVFVATSASLVKRTVLAFPIATVGAVVVRFIFGKILFPMVARHFYRKRVEELNRDVYGGALLHFYRPSCMLNIKPEIAIDLDQMKMHRRGLGSTVRAI